MIPIAAVQRTAEALMAKAAIEIPDDYLDGLRRAADTEKGDLSAEIPQGQQIDRVVRDVIDQDRPIRDPAHEVDAKVVQARGHVGLDRCMHARGGPQVQNGLGENRVRESRTASGTAPNRVFVMAAQWI